MTVISDSDQLPGQMVKTQCFSPEMAMISDSDQLPEQMVKTQHFAPELPVKCEPDQLEVQIVKTQHFTMLPCFVYTAELISPGMNRCPSSYSIPIQIPVK